MNRIIPVILVILLLIEGGILNANFPKSQHIQKVHLGPKKNFLASSAEHQPGDIRNSYSFETPIAVIPSSVTNYVLENTGDDSYEIVWDSGDILGDRVSHAIPADADGDGKGEIIVPCYDGKVYVFENTGPAVSTVKIDIKPGSWPNAVNPRGKGVIPVAILTTNTAVGESIDFDATSVDPLSIKFGLGEAMEVHGKGHIEDVDNDGDLDMVLHFKTQETGIQYGDTEACLTGNTSDGKSIQACDTIVTKGKEKK